MQLQKKAFLPVLSCGRLLLRGAWIRGMASVACGRLDGRVAIVTASTEGIGFSIAKKLKEEGAHVMVSSRRKDNVKNAVEKLRQEEGGGQVEGTVCHVGKAEHRVNIVKETVSKFGRLDILVSNAAVNPTFGKTLDAPESAWDKILDINIKAAALLVKECHPHLKASSCGGSVVLVTSQGGYLPFPMLGPYCVSKTALLGLIKVLSAELGPEGIRVNGIAPGIIKTKFSKALWSNEAVLDEQLKTVPLGRIGEADDCSGAVAFLCSDEAKYITGETIVMTGGSHSRL